MQEVADRIVLKILATSFVVALTLLALSCLSAARRWAAWCSLHWRSLVSPFGIPAIADWFMAGLYSLKYFLQDFITG